MEKIKTVSKILLSTWLLIHNGDITSMSLIMSWDWFEAQQQCIKNNDTLPSNTSASSEMEFWSGFYQRQSSWIKILGCYDSRNMQGYPEFLMIYSSAGFCHEICESVNCTIFGLKRNKCVCLDRSIFSSTVSSTECNEACQEETEGVRFSECGGPNAYSVYIADATFSLNLKETEPDRKPACLAINCDTMKTFSISFACSELYYGICEDKGYMGCFEDQWRRILSVYSISENTMTIERCRDFCLKKKTKFYGVEFRLQCYCGNSLTTNNRKPESDCNMECSGDTSQVCGGSWRINIYENPYYGIDRYAKQNWTESMKWCKTWPQPTYLYGNISSPNASLTCETLHRTRAGLSWLGIAKEVYIGYDRGFAALADQRGSFLQCQKCNKTDCAFVDCYNKLAYRLCNKTSLDEAAIVSDLTISDGSVTLVTIIAIISSLVLVFILVGCSVMVIIRFIHRNKKKAENKEKDTDPKRSNLSENCYANVNGDHAVIEDYSEKRPSSIHLTRQDKPEQSRDEPYRETLDGVYDHLGDMETEQDKKDDVYDHANFATELEDGVYHIGTSGISQNKSQDEATYDHAGSYSDYGHHGEQVDRIEDTYSRLQKKSRSGH